MRSNEERIRLLHERAKQMQKEHDRRVLLISGGISFVLLIALIAMIVLLRLLPTGDTDGFFAGASLLSDSAGGYVIVGAISLMLIASVTVMIRQIIVIKSREDHPDEQKTGRPSLISDETLFMAAGGRHEDDPEKENERNGK